MQVIAFFAFLTLPRFMSHGGPPLVNLVSRRLLLLHYRVTGQSDRCVSDFVLSLFSSKKSQKRVDLGRCCLLTVRNTM